MRDETQGESPLTKRSVRPRTHVRHCNQREQQMEKIHFIHNTGNGWIVVCMPNIPPSSIPNTTMRSDEPRAVTCRECMKSNIFVDRMAAIKAHEASKLR